MNIVITYCTKWNFLSQASRVEEEIKSVYRDADISKVLTAGGEFIVSVDEKVIFSKRDMIESNGLSFPAEGQIIALLKKAGY